MKQSKNCREHRWQRGVAAVELAIILPILMMLLTVPFYFGRAFWHYTVAEKAAHDAARYLSSIPVTEMKSQARIAAIVDVARQIYDQEVAELNPGMFPPTPTITCGNFVCDGISVPDTVRVAVRMRVFDNFAGTSNSDYKDEEGGIVLTADVTLPYVGK